MKKFMSILGVLICLFLITSVLYSQTISLSGVGVTTSYIKKFPSKTLVNVQDTMRFVINTVSGSNTVSGISISGDNFSLEGDASGGITTTSGITPIIRYTAPSTATTSEGSMTLSFASGNPMTIPIKAVSAEYILGDVTGSGEITSLDAAQVLKIVVGKTPTSTLSTVNRDAAADASGSGDIYAYDASLILQYTVGKIEMFSENLISKLIQQFEVGDVRINSPTIDGDILSVPIYLESSNVYSLEGSIVYNLASLEFIDIRYSNSLVGMMTQKNVENGVLRFALAGIEPVNIEEEVIFLIFKIKNKENLENIAYLDAFNINEYEFNVDKSPKINIGQQIPTYFSLSQNYPNPFNPETIIEYTLPDVHDVTLTIYNILGQIVKEFVFSSQRSGKYQINWDGTDNNGILLSSGVYIYRFKAGNVEITKRLVIIR